MQHFSILPNHAGNAHDSFRKVAPSELNHPCTRLRTTINLQKIAHLSLCEFSCFLEILLIHNGTSFLRERDSHRRAVHLHPPSVETYAKHDPSGVMILSERPLFEASRKEFSTGAGGPYGLAMSPDGRRLFVASDGVGQLLSNWQLDAPQITQVELTHPTNRKKGHSNGGGADFSPDGKLLYWSSGESGAVFVFDSESSKMLAEISLNVEVAGRKFEDSYVSDVKISRTGQFLYCADTTNFRLVIIDTKEHRVVGSVGVGRYPYALALAEDRVFVANIGLFEYSPVPPPHDDQFG